VFALGAKAAANASVGVTPRVFRVNHGVASSRPHKHKRKLSTVASYCGCFGLSSTAISKLTVVPLTLVTVTVTP
jgi:hypothetical protein